MKKTTTWKMRNNPCKNVFQSDAFHLLLLPLLSKSPPLPDRHKPPKSHNLPSGWNGNPISLSEYHDFLRFSRSISGSLLYSSSRFLCSSASRFSIPKPSFSITRESPAMCCEELTKRYYFEEFLQETVFFRTKLKISLKWPFSSARLPSSMRLSTLSLLSSCGGGGSTENWKLL